MDKAAQIFAACGSCFGHMFPKQSQGGADVFAHAIIVVQ